MCHGIIISFEQGRIHKGRFHQLGLCSIATNLFFHPYEQWVAGKNLFACLENWKRLRIKWNIVLSVICWMLALKILAVLSALITSKRHVCSSGWQHNGNVLTHVLAHDAMCNLWTAVCCSYQTNYSVFVCTHKTICSQLPPGRSLPLCLSCTPSLLCPTTV